MHLEVEEALNVLASYLQYKSMINSLIKHSFSTGITGNITYYEHQVFDTLNGEVSASVLEKAPKARWLKPK